MLLTGLATILVLIFALISRTRRGSMPAEILLVNLQPARKVHVKPTAVILLELDALNAARSGRSNRHLPASDRFTFARCNGVNRASSAALPDNVMLTTAFMATSEA